VIALLARTNAAVFFDRGITGELQSISCTARAAAWPHYASHWDKEAAWLLPNWAVADLNAPIHNISHGSIPRGASHMDWTLETAQQNLDVLIDRALTDGPQRVQVGGDAVVVLTEESYERLKAPRRSLKDLILNGPDLSGIDFTRDPSPTRDVDLD
jgi:hypothetical protein